MKSEAMLYAHQGWRCFPLHTPVGDGGCTCGRAECSKIGKHPRIAAWQKQATSDEAQISAWWKAWPEANIGLSLDGLTVLDVDPRHDGFESLAELEAEHGPLDIRARQRSGSGGWHYLFAQVAGVGTARGFKPGLDLLTGSGCYIVAAPSLHASGGRYEWDAEPRPMNCHRNEIELATPPQWLIAVATGAAKKPGRAGQGTPTADCASRDARPSADRLLADAIARVHAGSGRNDTGIWLFSQMRDNGFSKQEAADLLPQFVEAANAATPGQERYATAEARASLASAFNRAAREPWKTAGESDEPGAGLVQELANEILKENHFARDEGGLLYAFQGGVYRPIGERIVQCAVKALCTAKQKGKSWSPELASKVEAYLGVDAPDLWERPPLDTLNLRNGLLDIVTRALRPHDPSHLSPVQIDVEFDALATCPAIDAFVADVFPPDAQHIPAEITAWLMLPDTSIQKSVLAVGEGSNGKSVFLTLLERFIGRKNVAALSLHKIEADKFAAARLVGKLANICPDLPTVTLAGTSMFKALTGGDTISAERKFEASFEFRPYARLVFSANSAPRSDDATHGFFRRWLVIPFTRTFDEADPRTVTRAELDARLSAPSELSGLLNRALDALPQIRAGRFNESQSMRDAWQDFRRTTDPMAVWLDEHTVEHPEGHVAKVRLRTLYASDCKDAGRPIPPESTFSERLKRLRPKVGTKQRTVDGRPKTWCFTGIALRADQEPPDDGQMRF